MLSDHPQDLLGWFVVLDRFNYFVVNFVFKNWGSRVQQVADFGELFVPLLLNCVCFLL